MQPDFTGVWKLIRGESDFGFPGPPARRLDTITHNDPQICIRTRQKDSNGDTTVVRELAIGGPEVTVLVRGAERRIGACWQEDVLVVEARYEISGHARRIEDRWSMDAGGEWLTVARLFEQPGGAVRQRLRFRREVLKPEKA